MRSNHNTYTKGKRIRPHADNEERHQDTAPDCPCIESVCVFVWHVCVRSSVYRRLVTDAYVRTGDERKYNIVSGLPSAF